MIKQLLLCLLLNTAEGQAAPKETTVTQVFVETIFVEPKLREAADTTKFKMATMNGLPVRVMQGPSNALAVAKLVKNARTYTSPNILTADGEMNRLEVEGSFLAVQAKILAKHRVQLSLDQNFMKFPCSAGEFCRSKVVLTVADGETVVIDGVGTKSDGLLAQAMIITPHIIRSAADLDKVYQHKIQLRERQASPSIV